MGLILRVVPDLVILAVVRSMDLNWILEHSLQASRIPSAMDISGPDGSDHLGEARDSCFDPNNISSVEAAILSNKAYQRMSSRQRSPAPGELKRCTSEFIN